MRSLITTSLVLLIVLHAVAESPYERDLNQLKGQRDKALTAATDPINRRYKESLDDLLRRATQASDLDAATKIKEEINQLGIASPVSISSFTEKLLKQAWTWTSSPGSRAKLEFTRDGNVIHAGWKDAKWAAKPPNTLVITMGNAKATLKFNEAMTAFEGTDFGGTRPVRGEHF